MVRKEAKFFFHNRRKKNQDAALRKLTASISSCDQTKWRLNGLDMLFVPHACPTRNSGAAVAAPS